MSFDRNVTWKGSYLAEVSLGMDVAGWDVIAWGFHLIGLSLGGDFV